ncbi:MAG TPA: EamA family transporter [Thermoleophilaceae bacterium]|nr:EamA family transporter [Thermoleophilaceae bacterium]
MGAAGGATEGLLSVVAVLSSLYPLVTIVLARIYLRERIARRQQLGAAAALAGAIAISAA